MVLIDFWEKNMDYIVHGFDRFFENIIVHSFDLF